MYHVACVAIELTAKGPWKRDRFLRCRPHSSETISRRTTRPLCLGLISGRDTLFERVCSKRWNSWQHFDVF